MTYNYIIGCLHCGSNEIENTWNGNDRDRHFKCCNCGNTFAIQYKDETYMV